jgi:hypothetical protein
MPMQQSSFSLSVCDPKSGSAAPMDFEQAKKVLQLTDARIRKFGSIAQSTFGT